MTEGFDVWSSCGYGDPSESFRVLKEKELDEFGEFRTMRMVLEAFRKNEGA